MNTFRAVPKPPEGYRCTALIDPIRNKKLCRFLIRLSLALTVAGILLGLLWQPALGLLVSGGIWMALVRFAVMTAAIMVYIVAHEAVHGALMWLFSGRKPHFGFKLGCAYAGSPMYFGKNAYLLIAIAPLALWGAAAMAAAFAVPADWFWVVWGVQLTNLSGAVGDLYMFWHVLRKPRTVLVQDSGLTARLWLPS